MEHRQTTEHWAKSLNIPTAIIPPSIAGYEEPCVLSARDIAIRALILQGVVAVASGVEATPVVEWFRDQGIADAMGPREQSFFDNPHALNSELLNRLRWQREAEWALL